MSWNFKLLLPCSNCIVVHIGVFTVTDFPKSHPDSNLFLDCGINVMNIPEFMNTFMGKSVDQTEHQTSAEGKH